MSVRRRLGTTDKGNYDYVLGREAGDSGEEEEAHAWRDYCPSWKLCWLFIAT